MSEACPRAWHLNKSQEENQAVPEPRKFAECSRVSGRKGGWDELTRWKPSHLMEGALECVCLNGGRPPRRREFAKGPSFSPPHPHPFAWMLAALFGLCFVLFAQTFSCIILQSRCSSLKFWIATFPNRSEVLEQEGKLTQSRNFVPQIREKTQNRTAKLAEFLVLKSVWICQTLKRRRRRRKKLCNLALRNTFYPFWVLGLPSLPSARKCHHLKSTQRRPPSSGLLKFSYWSRFSWWVRIQQQNDPSSS